MNELRSRRLAAPAPGHPRPGALAALILAAACLAAAPALASGDPGPYGFGGTAPGDTHWVGTWATSPQATSALTFADQTLRMIVRTSVGGRSVRVRFSNAYGTAPLVIDAAHVALRAPCTVSYPGYLYVPPCPTCSPPTGPVQPPPPGGTCSTVEGSAIVPASDRVLTFGGATSAKVFPGAVMVSDPVDLDVPDLADLAVSFHLPGFASLVSYHGTAKQTSYLSAKGAGDLTAATVMPSDTTTTLSWYFVNTVEVRASSQTGAIVTLGDSITDANVSTPDMNFRWPYQLARRLEARLGNQKMGVLDHGTGGDKVTWDSVAVPAGANDSGQHRFDRDVIAAPGVTHAIVLLGVNDLRNSSPPDSPALVVSADDVIDGYRQMIRRAHSAGIKIFGGTLTPWWEGIWTNDNWTLEKWQKHDAINHWIRTSGAFDGVIDFDRCLADPLDPKSMLPAYDSGDHLHPSDAGYVRMGDCIDLSLVR